MKNLILILSLITPWLPGAYAQEPIVPTPLAFQEWKDQQVLDAQNQVLRASTRVAQARTGKAATPTNVPTGKKSRGCPTTKCGSRSKTKRRWPSAR